MVWFIFPIVILCGKCFGSGLGCGFMGTVAYAGNEMIIYTKDSIFRVDSDILVNPVNTRGKMGKGLAAYMREVFPRMYAEYVAMCRAGVMRIGYPFVVEAGERATITDITTTKGILLFPTKEDWAQPSKLEWIEEGLLDFRYWYENANTIGYGEYPTFSFPKLGCGLGGLPWAEVKALFEKYLASYPGSIRVHLDKDDAL